MRSSQKRMKESIHGLSKISKMKLSQKHQSMSDVLRETISFVLGKGCKTCRRSIPDNLWTSNVDAREFFQIIYCLLSNAMDALRGDSQDLEIIAENIAIETNKSPQLKEGVYIKIIFNDKGVGISEDNLARIFDPYFTTKPRGVGLGLSIVKAILEIRGGYITVESKIDVGSTFTVYLPTKKENKIDSGGFQQTKEIISENGKILVMESEEIVRKFIGTTITKLGYNVELTGTCNEALNLYKHAKKSGSAFDVLILDVAMSNELEGKDILLELLAIDPMIKGIVSSGHYNDPVITNHMEYGFKGTLVKPYDIEEIQTVLDKAMNLESAIENGE